MEVEILAGGSRLPAAQELALNELLKRYAGEVSGQALYKISWAAADNEGLARRHLPHCSKTDAFDWQCGCPPREPWKLPLCFHKNQCSYHLLSWAPPSPALERWENETGEDYSRGHYDCVLHFLDGETRQPVSPTSYIIEKMIPILRMAKEAQVAAMTGYRAVVERERAKRIERVKGEQKRKEREFEDFADAAIRDGGPAFSGAPHTGYGPKFRHGSDFRVSDRRRNFLEKKEE